MRVGFDIGGTFTDVIMLDDDGKLATAKVLSLLDQVGTDIGRFIDENGSGAKVEAFVHGTTQASNAVIENNTGRTGLLTTQGFRDELEMRGQRRAPLYDVNWQRTEPLIPRSRRLELKERILGSGQVDQALDLEHARVQIQKLLDTDVQAIAVCLINSYLNPTHEEQVGELIAKMAPGLPVCLSSRIHPEIREYERSSTTAVNACLIPVFDRYMGRLENALAGYSRRFLIMQSNGGIMSAAAARRKPAAIIESGPAAGVLAAARVAQEAGIANALSFDMGGTTAKACLVENGRPLEKQGGEVGGGETAGSSLFGGAGHAVRVPWLDIVEVGAGGGSIGWIDQGGALRVGPRSAGAEPGPVCYARGGKQATVTDANVVLGYMNPEAIAGGTLKIDRQAAWNAIDEQLAKPLKLSVLDAAYGIVRVANASMMRALRAVSTERGRDPREFTLIAFGGSGPLHAAELAGTLGIRRIYVPIYSGLFSALGLLLADYRHDAVRTLAVPLEGLDVAGVFKAFEQMEADARAAMREQIENADLVVERLVDVKYNYQISELTLPFPAVPAGEFVEHVKQLFDQAHMQQFGHVADDPLELVNLRVRVTAASSKLKLADLAPGVSKGAGAPAVRRDAYFGSSHGMQSAQVLRREDIGEERRYSGPLIVEQPDSTTVVPPGWSVRRDDKGNLVLETTAPA